MRTGMGTGMGTGNGVRATLPRPIWRGYGERRRVAKSSSLRAGVVERHGETEV